MLIKEYRIPLPLTVDEYRIAQLYMIQKKSQQESSGVGSGVEIITNEPYDDGPGGKGQYTYKIFHIGSHLPGWFRAILPKSALRVEEEAWNAYPYTRTRYTCPFIGNFLLDIETRYYGDSGSQDNVFNLNEAQLRERIVDVIDIVKDSISDYHEDEDPTKFRSKSNRGPLDENWIEKCVEQNLPIMCAYKLCKVEFRYWGMQTKIEKFIHDTALRRTMLRAHRQAWAWQDEWAGLTIDDIRRLEREAQGILNQKMAEARRAAGEDVHDGHINAVNSVTPQQPTDNGNAAVTLNVDDGGHEQLSRLRSGSRSPLHARSRDPSYRSLRDVVSSESQVFLSQDHLAAIRNDSSSEDEFYDAADNLIEDSAKPKQPLIRWSSVEMIEENAGGTGQAPSPIAGKETDVAACSVELLILVFHGGSLVDGGSHEMQHSKQADLNTFRTTVDSVIKSHYPSLQGHISIRLVPCPEVSRDAIQLLASLSPYGNQNSVGCGDSVASFTSDFLSPALIPIFSVVSVSYEDNVQAVISKANEIYGEFLDSEEGNGFNGDIVIVADMAGGLLGYDALLSHRTNLSRNPSSGSAYSDITDFSVATIPEDEIEDCKPLNSQTDAVFALAEFRAKQQQKMVNDDEADAPIVPAFVSHYSNSKRSCGDDHQFKSKSKFDFKPSELFLFGSPLGLVLAHRQLESIRNKQYGTESPRRPPVAQVYNLFYAIDPCCARLEPLLHLKFSNIHPVTVPRYQRFPLGNGQPLHLVESIERYKDQLLPTKLLELHSKLPDDLRTLSAQLSVNLSGSENLGTASSNNRLKSNILKRRSSSDNPCQNFDAEEVTVSNIALISSFASIAARWWGNKRCDYSLYCPDGLSSFPISALPNLLHASYWESKDVAAFILRQFVNSAELGESDGTHFSPAQPTEKWLRRQTSYKIKSTAANHRGNDLLITEEKPQILTARFMYGSLDVVTLSGEKVDIYVMTNLELGEWVLFGTETTDNHGRISFTIPVERRLPCGLWPVKMVVKGDHTFLDMFLAVVPPNIDCVVFSIDGSFTASMSVSGKDPRIRPGAVDCVRHWQELGYLILYVTARPDMQRRVSSWLAGHNFPHGLVFFTDGISTDPLRQKTQYLKGLATEMKVKFHCGYGSSKDINVYREAGMTAENIFVVGRATKKYFSQAQVLVDGYAAHLANLNSGIISLSRPASGNGRMILKKGYFSLPGQLRRPGFVQRSHSFTPRTGKYESTTLSTKNLSPDAAVSKFHGKSPFRIKKPFRK